MIKYIRTPKGRFMLCEPSAVYYIPHPTGYDLVVTPGGEVVHGYVINSRDDNARMGYAPHWANCSYKKARPAAANTARPAVVARGGGRQCGRTSTANGARLPLAPDVGDGFRQLSLFSREVGHFDKEQG